MATLQNLLRPNAASTTPAGQSLTTSDGQFRVLDGDTFEVLSPDREPVRIRVEGIDTPETAKPWAGEPNPSLGGDLAAGSLLTFLESGIESGDLRIEELGETDVYGRQLARVNAGGRDYGQYATSEGGIATPRYAADYNHTRGALPADGVSEEARLAAADQFGQASTESNLTRLLQGPEVTHFGGEVSKGMKRGAAYSLAGLNALVGRDEAAADHMDRAQSIPSATASVKDIDDFGSGWDWFLGKVGEQIPTLAMDASAFVGGAITGLGVGGFTAAAALRGGTRLALSSMVAQNAGEVAANLSEDDTIGLGKRLAYSLPAGVAMGTLDYLAVGWVLKDAGRALGIRNPTMLADGAKELIRHPSFMNRAALIGATSGIEGVTEFVQEGISTVAKTLAKTGQLPTMADWDNFVRNEGLEALAAGAAIGGALSGTVHTTAGGAQYAWSKLAQERVYAEAQQQAEQGNADQVAREMANDIDAGLVEENRRTQDEIRDNGGSEVGVTDTQYQNDTRPSPEVAEAAGFAPTTTAPEGAAALDAQYERFLAGEQNAHFISSSEADYTRRVQNLKAKHHNVDAHVVEKPEGTLVFKPKSQTDRDRIIAYRREQDADQRDGMRSDLLGYANNKQDMAESDEPLQSVTTRDAEGNEIRSEAVPESQAEAVAQQRQEQARPGDVTMVESVEDTLEQRSEQELQEEADAQMIEDAEAYQREVDMTSEIDETEQPARSTLSGLMQPQENNNARTESNDERGSDEVLRDAGEPDAPLVPATDGPGNGGEGRGAGDRTGRDTGSDPRRDDNPADRGVGTQDDVQGSTDRGGSEQVATQREGRSDDAGSDLGSQVSASEPVRQDSVRPEPGTAGRAEQESFFQRAQRERRESIERLRSARQTGQREATERQRNEGPQDPGVPFEEVAEQYLADVRTDLRDWAGKIFDLATKAGVTISYDPDLDSPGRHFIGHNQIVIRPQLQDSSFLRHYESSPESLEAMIVTHELLHYLTSEAIVANSSFEGRLDAMIFHIKRLIDSGAIENTDASVLNGSALENSHELIAYGLSHTRVMAALLRIPRSDFMGTVSVGVGLPETDSAFRELVDVVSASMDQGAFPDYYADADTSDLTDSDYEGSDSPDAASLTTVVRDKVKAAAKKRRGVIDTFTATGIDDSDRAGGDELVTDANQTAADVNVRVIDENDQAQSEISRYFSPRQLETMQAATAAASHLRSAYPTQAFSVITDGKGRPQIQVVPKTFEAEADAQSEADQLSDESVTVVPILMDSSGWTLHSVMHDPELGMAQSERQGISQALGRGSVIRNQYLRVKKAFFAAHNARAPEKETLKTEMRRLENKHFMVAKDGNLYPIHIDSLTALGRRLDGFDRGNAQDTANLRDWFTTALGSLMAAGYEFRGQNGQTLMDAIGNATVPLNLATGKDQYVGPRTAGGASRTRPAGSAEVAFRQAEANHRQALLDDNVDQIQTTEMALAEAHERFMADPANPESQLLEASDNVQAAQGSRNQRHQLSSMQGLPDETVNSVINRADGEIDASEIREIADLYAYDRTHGFFERMVTDDTAFTAFEDVLAQVDPSLLATIARHRTGDAETRETAGAERDTSTDAVSRGSVGSYLKIRRSAMTQLRKLNHELEKAHGDVERTTELLQEIKEQIREIESYDERTVSLLGENQDVDPGTFNQFKRDEETGRMEDQKVIQPGTVPFWFAKKLWGGSKVGKEAVVFGSTEVAERVLKAFKSMIPDMPNVVVITGKNLPDNPLLRRYRRYIWNADQRGDKGFVIYDGGFDFATIWVDPRLGKVEQTAVMAHEMAHIYVKHALDQLRAKNPGSYRQTMAEIKQMAGDLGTDGHKIEWLTNQLVLKAFDNFADIDTTKPALRKMVTWMRRFFKKIQAYLGTPNREANDGLSNLIANGYMDKVRAGYSAPYANRGEDYFHSTMAKWRPARLNKLWERMTEATKLLAKGAAPIVRTLDHRLRAIDPALSDLFWTGPGNAGMNRKSNYLGRKNSDAREWDSIFTELERRMGNNAKAAIDEYFAAGENDTLSRDAERVHRFFKKFHTDYMKKRMPTIGEIKNRYKPTLYDISEVSDRSTAFMEILQKHGYSEERAQQTLQAIADMDGYDDPELGALLESHRITGAPTARAAKRRSITDEALLTELREAGFMPDDNQAVVRHYVWQMTRRAALEGVAGSYERIDARPPMDGESLEADAQILREKFVQSNNKVLLDTLDALETSNVPTREAYRSMLEKAEETGFLRWQGPEGDQVGWYNPTARIKQRLTAIQNNDPAAARQAYNMVQAALGRVGLDMDPDLRRLQSRVATYQAYTTLAFIVTAGLPDLMGPILRMRRLDYMIPAIRDSFKAMMDYKRTEQEARLFGFGSERMDHIQIQEMYGMQFSDAASQKWNERLFKWNGQKAFTHMTRAVSLDVGKKAFLRAENDLRTGTAAEQQAAREFLQDFGLTGEHIAVWQRDGQPSAVSLYDGDYTPEQVNRTQEIHQALHRFVDESIVRPNAAVRPEWASNPKFMLLWQLKSFFYAYGKVVVAPFMQAAHQRIRAGDISGGLAPYLVAVPGLMLLAFLGMQLRDGIQKVASYGAMSIPAMFSDDWEDERDEVWGNSYFDNMGMGEYAWEMTQRTGIFGPWQMLLDMGSDRDLGDRVAGVMGPAPQQALDIFKTGVTAAADTLENLGNGPDTDTDWEGTLMRAIPGINQFSSLKGAFYNQQFGN